MLMLWRNIKADFIKLKRTSIIYIHILIPIIGAPLFLLYYSVSSWGGTDTKLAAYYQTMAIIFPLLIGIITGIIAEQEEQAGGFQNMFIIFKRKATSYCSKLLVLLLLSIFSIIIAIFTFASVFKNYTLEFYTRLGVALFLGNIFLYILHLFISFRFGKGASIGLGIAGGVLIAALMETGLGDGIWHITPWAWGGIRFCDFLMLIELNQLSLYDIFLIIRKGGILILIISIFIGLALVYFGSIDGRGGESLMIEAIYKRTSLIIFIITLSIILSACSIIDNKISALNNEIPKWEINKDNGTQVIYDNKFYQIIRGEIDKNEIGKLIGRIGKIAILDGNYQLIGQEVLNVSNFF